MEAIIVSLAFFEFVKKFIVIGLKKFKVDFACGENDENIFIRGVWPQAANAYKRRQVSRAEEITERSEKQQHNLLSFRCSPFVS